MFVDCHVIGCLISPSFFFWVKNVQSQPQGRDITDDFNTDVRHSSHNSTRVFPDQVYVWRREVFSICDRHRYLPTCIMQCIGWSNFNQNFFFEKSAAFKVVNYFELSIRSWGKLDYFHFFIIISGLISCFLTLALLTKRYVVPWPEINTILVFVVNSENTIIGTKSHSTKYKQERNVLSHIVRLIYLRNIESERKGAQVYYLFLHYNFLSDPTFWNSLGKLSKGNKQRII